MKSLAILFFSLLSISAKSALSYQLYHPKTMSNKNMAMVVVLHGCRQDAKLIEKATQWNQLAEKHGFLVLYPDQKTLRNPINCWNWFLPFNQTSLGGEPLELVRLVQKVSKRYGVNSRKIFITGLSSGAAMANIVVSCFPKLFAGVGLHSGPAYASAFDIASAYFVLDHGPTRLRVKYCNPRNFKGKVVIIQGDMDKRVNPAHADLIFKDFVGQHPHFKQYVTPPNGHKDYVIYSDIEKRVKLYEVIGLEHAWSGGLAGENYTDPTGPDATSIMYQNFF